MGKIVDDFYVGFEPRLEKAEKEMREVEIKDEPAGEDCELCNHPMVFKWVNTGNLWLARISQIVVIQSRL